MPTLLSTDFPALHEVAKIVDQHKLGPRALVAASIVMLTDAVTQQISGDDENIKNAVRGLSAIASQVVGFLEEVKGSGLMDKKEFTNSELMTLFLSDITPVTEAQA